MSIIFYSENILIFNKKNIFIKEFKKYAEIKEKKFIGCLFKIYVLSQILKL